MDGAGSVTQIKSGRAIHDNTLVGTAASAAQLLISLYLGIIPTERIGRDGKHRMCILTFRRAYLREKD
jgi:hypothetical protein